MSWMEVCIVLDQMSIIIMKLVPKIYFSLG